MRALASAVNVANVMKKINFKGAAGRSLWKASLLRVGMDLLFTNGSLVAAGLLWAAMKSALFSQELSPIRIITGGKISLATYLALWSALSISTFHLHGFYTRTRGYAHWRKALVIARAVTLVVIVFMAVDRFLLLGGFSRGVAVLGWVFMMLTVGGIRLSKDVFVSNYRIEPRAVPAGKINRVLVVGGAGYLGTALIPQLLAKQYKVRLLDSFVYGDESIATIKDHTNFELVRGDVRDIGSVVDAMKDCDAVIDLAAIVGDPACEENRRLAVEINRVATRMLIEIAHGYGVQRFLFASSCSVYGASDFLMDEFSAVAPISTYARTKVDSERLLLEAASKKFHPTILRLGTLFGLSARPRFDLVVNLLTARAAITGKITVFNGQQWRPFLHVHDAARAFVMCLEAEPALVGGEVFNVGDYMMNHRLSEVSDKVAAIVPHVEITRTDNADKRNYRVSFDKIHTRVGFRCQISVDRGVRELYDWLQKNPDLNILTSAEFNNVAMIRMYAETAAAQHCSIRALQTLAETA